MNTTTPAQEPEHTDAADDVTPSNTEVETTPDAPPPTARGRIPLFTVLRTAWLAVTAVGMLIVFFAGSGGAEMTDPDGRWETDVDSAASRYEANEELTSGAPQQSVANGWHTNELLEIQADIVAESSSTAAENSGTLHAELRTATTLILLLGLGLLGDRTIRLWTVRNPSPLK